jgi:hypothetical protein
MGKTICETPATPTEVENFSTAVSNISGTKELVKKTSSGKVTSQDFQAEFDTTNQAGLPGQDGKLDIDFSRTSYQDWSTFTEQYNQFCAPTPAPARKSVTSMVVPSTLNTKQVGTEPGKAISEDPYNRIASPEMLETVASLLPPDSPLTKEQIDRFRLDYGHTYFESGNKEIMEVVIKTSESSASGDQSYYIDSLYIGITPSEDNSTVTLSYTQHHDDKMPPDRQIAMTPALMQLIKEIRQTPPANPAGFITEISNFAHYTVEP